MPGLHQIELNFVNVYLLEGPEGLALVDAGMPNSVGKVVKALEELGHSPKDLRAILITHGDIDHVGGLRRLQEMSGAAAYGPAAEVAAIHAGEMPRSPRNKPVKRFLGRLAGRLMGSRPGRIDHPFQEGDRLPFFGGLVVVTTPGHTNGHASLFQPERKILFAGDSMNTRGGLIGTSPRAMTWDEGQMLASVKKQAALRPEVLCCGHGQPITTGAAALLDAFLSGKP